MYRKLEEDRAAGLTGDEETASAAETECVCTCKEPQGTGTEEAPQGVQATVQIGIDLDING